MSTYYRRLRMHWMEYRMKILIAAAVILLVALSVIGLWSLESFYRQITLAQLPVTILIGGIHAIVFTYMYLVVLRGGFTKTDKKEVRGRDVNIRFSDVIGIDAAKEEAWEVVQLIKDHVKLAQVGGKILKGILMVGPPGCGKTYLAKAIATEAELPFLSMSASEFVEIFVGVGASRVRQLFKKARSLAYGFGGCIVFIDELDAMGKNRTFNQWGNTETNSTQNQLLVEMDGLGAREENVVIIGATNAPEDSLDPALLRPGRFDRKVYIARPNLDGRQKLFDYYLSKVKHEANIDTGVLARKAVHYSPAEIEAVVKESALIATRNKRDAVTYREITEAIERIELGFKTNIKMTPREKEMTAYHESGHLIITYLLHPTDDVFKASVIPRRQSLGVVHRQPREELFNQSREEILANIKTCLAGYAAERVKFAVTTSGVSDDFRKAMQMAHGMVWVMGMGPSGLVGDFTALPDQELSEEVKAKLNYDTNKILQDCIHEVEAVLKKEIKILDRFAHELVQRDELEYDDIESIFAEFGKANPRIVGPAEHSDTPPQSPATG